jgi:hypothetical protein
VFDEKLFKKDFNCHKKVGFVKMDGGFKQKQIHTLNMNKHLKLIFTSEKLLKYHVAKTNSILNKKNQESL